MKNSRAHTAAIVLAVLALAVIAMGALLTSETRHVPGWETVSPASSPGLEGAHRIAGYSAAALTLGVAVLALNPAGWILLAAGVAEALTGGIPVIHAILSPIYFSLIVVVALLTSKSWQSPPEPVVSSWAPARVTGIHAAPFLILMQIGLGAAFRHNAMASVISHVMNALIVLAAVLVAGIFVLRQFPDHPALRPAALGYLIVTGIQVLLGFSVYLILLMSSENNPGLIITGMLHVTNGALTLAASVVFALQMSRHLRSQTGK